MRCINFREFSLFITLMLVACNPAPLRQTARESRNVPSENQLNEQVDALLRQMTLEEKIGQLTLYTSDLDTTGPSVRPEYLDDIKAGRVGSIFNAYTAPFTRRLQKLAVEHSRLHIPLIFGYDVVHGFKTIFPIPLGETASWDLGAIETSARIAATEAAAAGVHWTYAPMVDIARDPRWGRVAEGAGEDTFLGSQVATARVRGFQGQNTGGDDTVMSCVKHFAAYGAADGGRDYNTVDVSERTLREVYFPPFKAAIDAGVSSVMASFNEISGVPSTASRWLMTDILRGEWNFKGFVVSDYTGINELIPHGVAADLTDAGKLALNAGVDLDMQGSVYSKELPKLVASGEISETQIDNAAARILRWKFKMGLFADPYKFSDEQREKDRVFTDANLWTARDIGKKSIVLLKNNDSLLPLAKNIGTIAVIGPLGADRKELIGSWSAAGDSSKAVSLLEGVKAKVSPSTHVLYAKGIEINSEDSSGFAGAMDIASKADVIIAALGEAALMSGEAASRSSIDLPGRQLELLKELAKLGKPIVLVLMNGRPLILNWPQEHIPSILETWFLGSQAGNAIADVLFGDYNPSGRLPISFPRAEGQIPLYYNAKNTGRPFASDNKYTSKYLDVANTPLYPFGFGLSYTTFSYANVRLSSKHITRDDTLKVQVDVTNSGGRDGTETVQLYLTDVVATVTRPVKELKGFKQVALKSGETTTVEFTVTRDALAFYNQKMVRTVEPGLFKVHVGPNSDAVLMQEFTLK